VYNLIGEEEIVSRKTAKSKIRQAEKNLNRTIVGYISTGRNAMIDKEDPSLIQNLLEIKKTQPDREILLILDTFGGLVEPVLHIINILRHFSNGSFEVFVPRYAKSAGTMLCLGASKILMGLASEIGPVDTQIAFNDKYFSAKIYCEEYERILEEIERLAKQDPILDSLLSAYYLQLEKMDNVLYLECKTANERVARMTVEVLENNSSYSREPREIKKNISEKLVYGYLDHGDVINFEEAVKIGLKAEMYQPRITEWKILTEVFYRYNSIRVKENSNKMIFTADDSLFLY